MRMPGVTALPVAAALAGCSGDDGDEMWSWSEVVVEGGTLVFDIL